MTKIKMTDRNTNLKYRLKELSEIFIRASDIKEREFARKMRIPWSTYQKDKHSLVTDSFSMPEYRLQIYAAAFGVSLESILNYGTKQRCLVVEEQFDDKLIEKYNLRYAESTIVDQNKQKRQTETKSKPLTY
ncbi:hypothetical protein [Roseivirga misakiensis]|nr:hypothetical protein [Roseivirga misakiensis]